VTDRAAAERRGRRAERLAAAYLTMKGYRVLERRVRTPVGEIDLIAEKGRTLVFVEIKQRSGGSGSAEAVTPRQRHRITRAALAYLGRNPGRAEQDVRFDIILIDGLRPHHLAAAWRPDT